MVRIRTRLGARVSVRVRVRDRVRIRVRGKGLLPTTSHSICYSRGYVPTTFTRLVRCDNRVQFRGRDRARVRAM